MGYTKKEILSQMKECFFENFVFNKYKDGKNDSWVDGANSIVCDLFNNKKVDLKIGELIDYLNINGDLKDISTYKTFEDDLMDIENPRFYPISAENTKVGYYSILVESVKAYVQNRNTKLEEVFDLFVKELVEVSTLGYASVKLNNGKLNEEVCYKYDEILKSDDFKSLVIEQKNSLLKSKI